MTETEAQSAYTQHVNPQWVRLLNLLEMNAEYVRCRGEKLETADGRTILDFLSGYCVYNAGHNHPHIVEALYAELGRCGPSMLQSHVAASAGELAEQLCRRAGGRLNKAYFCSSGSEGVETAIKFSRAFTGRSGLLAARGAFHGLSCGALALMDNGFWSEGFGPLIPGVEFVPFGDLAALERRLAAKKHAALILEPIQGEGGILVPGREYLEGAQQLCRRCGTLLVIDEVQTGLWRTGRFLAGHHYGLDPDMVILAKALSGGLVPVGAVLMTDDIYDSVYGSLRRAIVHTSTYSESGLAMRAGLATLEVLEQERMGERALAFGEVFRQRLREVCSKYEMVAEVRGMGFFTGIAFKAPKSLGLRLSYEAFHRIHPAMFGQMLVMRMYCDHGVLTQICGNDFSVLKAAPPLNAEEESLDHFVRAIDNVLDLVHSSRRFWRDALHLATRAIKI
ncbi:aspartate aminotransferase family protein [Acidipila sp. 4G-K13]|uniref:Aspartate aminotransferase family protein n=2 Tax=Paracidobacterium acidisoli TaxID=2303751 RepID=A0A372IKP2_9BACT|nr:aspartate aminotransferase family protein [Paracidobacterium acidisoli]MBT9332814.1 aspartate aminotransferase family protein [Paracidobacterium acidisoli]